MFSFLGWIVWLVALAPYVLSDGFVPVLVPEPDVTVADGGTSYPPPPKP